MARAYVYFVREALGEMAPIKIGVARDIDLRLRELQVGNSRRLEIMARLGPLEERAAYGLERSLHRRFKRFRIRGEWFYGSIITQMHTLREYKDLEMVA